MGLTHAQESLNRPLGATSSRCRRSVRVDLFPPISVGGGPQGSAVRAPPKSVTTRLPYPPQGAGEVALGPVWGCTHKSAPDLRPVSLRTESAPHFLPVYVHNPGTETNLGLEKGNVPFPLSWVPCGEKNRLLVPIDRKGDAR
jgi:hypothetical protein